jgi:alanyl-tRNA synthetase
MFYDVTEEGLGDMTHDEYLQADERKDVVEIWNDVFMEYQKKDGVVIGKLAQKNVDTGSGLERVTMVVQGKNNIYDTDIFTWAIDMIRLNAKGEFSLESARIIADHIRTGTMLIADGVVPLNKDQGYVLRRLIRRAVLKANNIGLNHSVLIDLRMGFASWYEKVYPELAKNVEVQGEVFSGEIEKFNKTLHNGLKEFEKGTDPFILATTYGFPIEVTIELAKEKGIAIDRNDFDVKMKMHQDASRSGAEQKFKGGLANHSEKTVRLHTAHHLLLAALQTVLGKEVKQKGSNITDERLRLDFSFDRKMTDEEKKEVEDLVNTWIQKELPVVKKEMPKTEAETLGAEMEFGAKYADIVSVYMIGDGEIISKEFCGGPHVSNTKEIGTFVLQKEEASSQGVRRIKGSIE